MGCQQRLRGAVNAVLSVGRSTGGRLERRRGQPGEVLPSGHSSGILRIGEAGDLRGGLRGSSLLRLLLDAHGTLLLPRRIEAAVADAVLLGHKRLGDVSLGRGGAGLTLSRFGEASDHETVGHTASIRHDLRRTNILELSDVIDRGALISYDVKPVPPVGLTEHQGVGLCVRPTRVGVHVAVRGLVVVVEEHVTVGIPRHMPCRILPLPLRRVAEEQVVTLTVPVLQVAFGVPFIRLPLVEGLLEVPRERVGGVSSGTSNVEVQIAVEVLVTRILQMDHPVLVGHLPQQKGLTSHSFGRRHRLETDRALDVQRRSGRTVRAISLLAAMARIAHFTIADHLATCGDLPRCSVFGCSRQTGVGGELPRTVTVGHRRCDVAHLHSLRSSFRFQRGRHGRHHPACTYQGSGRQYAKAPSRGRS